MKEKQKIYIPEEVDYKKIIPVYQEAFKGDPWFEVSKCADSKKIKRCEGGYTSIPVGSCCGMCKEKIIRPAYEDKELVYKFTTIANSRPTRWYIEQNDLGITMAALAWTNTPREIAEERYPDVPEMKEWIQKEIAEEKIIWIDEVFADKTKKTKGNLKNFKSMCKIFWNELKTDTIAYRTITPAMINAPKRDFPGKNIIYNRKREVPDRRDFVIIRSSS